MIQYQPIRVATGSADDEGRLVLHDGLLVAVIVRLSDPSHGTDRGQWNVEAAFDGIDGTEPPLFADLDAAGRWFDDQLKSAMLV